MAATTRADYGASEQWLDVVPIPLDEGGPHPLAAIAYTDEYTQAMSYLRAIMAAEEVSERALELTEHIISLNPAHYTVWLYRASILQQMQKDPLQELLWLNATALRHVKNYQIWQHRQVIMALVPSLPTTELPFLVRMLAKDPKNYHVWTYRQWLVKHFSLWPSTTLPGSKYVDSPEVKFVSDLIADDVRNNSAWNHRFFVLFGRHQVEPPYSFDPSLISDSVWKEETAYAKEKIATAPQNLSAWNYLEGIQKKSGQGLEDLEDFAAQFASIDEPDNIRSSHALSLLAEIWGKSGRAPQARTAFDLLATKIDPIRANFWKWRSQSLTG